MKLYTRTGDEGQTSVIGGRVYKDDVRVEAYGAVDELNSSLGLAISYMDDATYSSMKEHLKQIQHELFDCGTDLARLKQGGKPFVVTAEMVDRLEVWIDRYDEETSPLARFIMPGGSQVSAALHVCRATCRRAERCIVALGKEQQMNEQVRRYMNRLSDLFFTLARVANVREGVADVEYVQQRT